MVIFPDLNLTVRVLFENGNLGSATIMNKKVSREKISIIFNDFSSQKKEKADFEILKKFKKVFEEGSFKNVGTYISSEKEVSSNLINTYLLKKKCKLFAPKVQSESKTLKFTEYLNNEDLVENNYGILEPKNDNTFPIEELDLVIVPLRAFSKDLKRLGFGSGYYDRTFENHKSTNLLGLAYSFQYLENLILEEFDIKLSSVITEDILF